MAGKKIYIGAMMDTLMENIAAMTIQMQSNVDMLTLISNNTSQSVSTVNVASGEEVQIKLLAADESGANAQTFTLGTWYSNAIGTVNLVGSFSATWTPSGYTSTVTLQYSKDDGATWTTLGVTATLQAGNLTQVVPFNVLVPVISGSKIKFKSLQSNGNASCSVKLIADTYIKYNLKNVISSAFNKS